MKTKISKSVLLFQFNFHKKDIEINKKNITRHENIKVTV